MRQARTLLREASTWRRVVGFQDAVDDLGTHPICGTETPYSRQMVYNVLHGRSQSKKLLVRIVERRPDLLELSFVAEATKRAARALGWTPKARRSLAISTNGKAAGRSRKATAKGAGHDA